jgi:hypothetical protein
MAEQMNRTYRVSHKHNTWDYKNALGQPLNDNIQGVPQDLSTKAGKTGKYLILELKIILFKRGVSGYGAWTFL